MIIANFKTELLIARKEKIKAVINKNEQLKEKIAWVIIV